MNITTDRVAALEPSIMDEVSRNNVTNDSNADGCSSTNTGHVDSTSFLHETAIGAKSRRKRTSPRDHAILESAYQQNSKPDKDERAKLVAQVELSEKEVQIWFQNRRQNDRRKSKPLAPHELIPHFRNGVPEEAIQRQLPSPFNSQEKASQPSQSSPTDSQAQHSFSSPNKLRSILNHDDPDASLSSPTEIRHHSGPVTGSSNSRGNGSGSGSQQVLTPPSSAHQVASKTKPNAPRSQERGPLATTTTTTPTPAPGASSDKNQIAKKRSHEQMSENEMFPHALSDSVQAAKSIRRTSSFLQLALSQDGSAKVRRSDETTPSPPKERPQPLTNAQSRRSSGFTRAQSDLSSTFQFRDLSAVRGPPGRSRDARTWEFFCDRNARSSLAARAEQEASGSAVGAIGLVRSASGRRMQPLAANSARQNRLRQTVTSAKPKPQLVRAQSSMARLQTSQSLSSDDDPKSQRHRRQSSSSDSDKENWLPGTRNSQNAMRRTEPSRPRDTILQVHDDSIVPHGHPSPVVLPSGNDQENRKTNTKGKGKTKPDDLDCVKGLLSLSQGAWK